MVHIIAKSGQLQTILSGGALIEGSSVILLLESFGYLCVHNIISYTIMRVSHIFSSIISPIQLHRYYNNNMMLILLTFVLIFNIISPISSFTSGTSRSSVIGLSAKSNNNNNEDKTKNWTLQSIRC